MDLNKHQDNRIWRSPKPWLKMWVLIITRLDIAYAVQTFSQFMHAPRESHMNSALRIIKYMKRSLGLGLLMDKISKLKLNAYDESDWVSCPMSKPNGH